MAYPLTLEELYNGCVRPLAVERRIVCPSCRGSGAKPGHTLKECSLCGGEGAEGRQCEECGMRNWWGPAYVLDGPDRNAIVVAGPDGQHFIVPLPNKQKPSHPTVELQPCDSRCSQCHGAKLVKEKKTHTVLVEKGTDRGHRIVFEEASNEHPGTIPGDVILHIEGKSWSCVDDCAFSVSFFSSLRALRDVRLHVCVQNIIMSFSFVLRALQRSGPIRASFGRNTTSCTSAQ